MTAAIRALSWTATLCLLGVIFGCSRGGDREVASSTAAAEQPRTAAAEQPPTVATDQIPTVTTVTAAQVSALVNERKGKVVVVNFWASWCPPCLREFPDIIKTYNQYHAKGLDVIAVSMNSPEETTDIKEFLQNYKPPFPIYRADTEDGTFYESVLKQWFGEMPLTLVFDTAGKNVLTHRKEITYEELSSKVQALLPPQGKAAAP